MRVLAIVGLAVAVGAPAAAQSATGMGALQYYVGTWSCEAGTVGQPATKATATYALDSGVLRGWIVVPAQGKMTKPYSFSSATSYDAKDGRYVQSTLDNDAVWSVSFAKPWTGETELWIDHTTSNGKLTHGETVRTSATAFSFSSYPTLTSTKANFKGTCTRSS